MGWTWEVNVWSFENGQVCWAPVYAGESLLVAIFAMWKSKRAGFGCIKLEWR